MSDSKFRVGGGYTVFQYNNSPLLYVQTVTDQAPQPVAAPEPVQPLDAPRPIEIAFAAAHGVGNLQLSVFEQWESPVWATMVTNSPFAGLNDIVDVFRSNVNNGAVTCTKIVNIPRRGNAGASRRIKTYSGCYVTMIDDSETVNVGTITLPKAITITYTQAEYTNQRQ